MPTNKFTSKTREELLQFYMNALKEDTIPWEKGWSGGEPNHNEISGARYRGINQLRIWIEAYQKKYTDPRWVTFNQISDREGKYHKGEKWHLKAGSKGVPIEHWNLRRTDPETGKKTYINAWELKDRLAQHPEEEGQWFYTVSVSSVFNMSCVEGAPEYQVKTYEKPSNELLQEFCEEANRTMGVEVVHGGGEACYVPSEDKIYLPNYENFKSTDDYYATRLHETGHSTGAEKRLNRELTGGFGSEQYAKEELRAEIGSSLIYADLHMPETERTLDNNKAYIQNWIEVLKNEPDVLFQAIHDAESISDYVLEHAPVALAKIREVEKEQDVLREKTQEDVKETEIPVQHEEAVHQPLCNADNPLLENVMENVLPYGHENERHRTK